MYKTDVWNTAQEALDEKANYGEFWKEVLHKSGADQVVDMADAITIIGGLVTRSSSRSTKTSRCQIG